MKSLLLPITLLCSLIVLSGSTRVTQEIYPCPHSGTTRLPHSSSCNKYVQCVNGFAVEEDCARGLFFSPDQQMCTPEWQANCVVEQSPCPTWTDPENLVFLSNGMQCSQYFMCYNGQPIVMQCASGLTFNSSTNQCSQESCRVSLRKILQCHFNNPSTPLFTRLLGGPVISVRTSATPMTTTVNVTTTA